MPILNYFYCSCAKDEVTLEFGLIAGSNSIDLDE
jgi:hypothetical protein